MTNCDDVHNYPVATQVVLLQVWPLGHVQLAPVHVVGVGLIKQTN